LVKKDEKQQCRVFHRIIVKQMLLPYSLLLVLTAPYYTLPSSTAIHVGSIFVIDDVASESIRSALHSTMDVAKLSNLTLTNPAQSAQARFGWSCAVVDLNGDGIDDLAVSAPGAGHVEDPLKQRRGDKPPADIYSGRVYVYFGHAKSGLSSTPDITIRPGDALDSLKIRVEQLGHALATGDVDGDGKKDLIIGCPYCSTRYGSQQVGAVIKFRR
jgi:hypothetical protein